MGDWVCGPDEAQALAASQRSEGGELPAAALYRECALEVIFARLLKLAAGPVYVDNVRTIAPYTEKARTEYRMTEQLRILPALIEGEFTAPSWD